MKINLKMPALRKAETTSDDAGIKVNPYLLDYLAPNRFSDAGRDYLEVADTVRDIHAMKDYPPSVGVDWFKVGLIRPRAITTFSMVPSDREKLRRAIDHSDARQGVRLMEGGTASKEEAAVRAREHGRSMLRIMGDSNESFWQTMIFEQLVEKDPTALKVHDKTFTSLAGGASLTSENCIAHEQEAYFAASPWWVETPGVFKRWSRDMCGSTIAAALPFQDNSIDDGAGIALGICKPDETICRLNMMTTANGRKNCNAFISGSSGSGKTTALKHIIYHEVALGAKVIVVDYEREFKTGCRNAGGQWVDMGKGHYTKNGKDAGAWLSPLEPRFAVLDPTGEFGDEEDVEREAEQREVLRPTMKFLHGWTELAWGLKGDDMSYLDHGLERAYGKYGITYDTKAADLKAGEYPIFEDLVEVFDALAQEALDSRFAHDAEIYHRLAIKAGDCTADKGYCGNLWARRSNVDIKSDFVVFDTLELTDADARVRAAQLFSIMTWIWSQACVSRVTGQFLRVVFDEGHMIFSDGKKKKDNSSFTSLEAASFLNMMQKRIRKYNGGIIFATQQLSDVLGEDIISYGEALISSSAYKFFFGTDGTDLELLVRTMNMSTFVKGIIENFPKGDCLLDAEDASSVVHIVRKDYIEDFWKYEEK